MGSTDYYQANVTARELAAVAKIASEIDDWQHWSLVERFQRELAFKRIREEIVPYLVCSRDRFFGSLIVVIYKPELFVFEPLQLVNADVPSAYRDAADRMGFLVVNGGDLVVLDGQHRLVALREVVDGLSRHHGEFEAAIAQDDLSVVFVGFESLEKTRRIFNKVNRYAKPTSPTDNIITSEDDGYAIVARWLTEETPPLGLSDPEPPLALFTEEDEPLIEWRSAQLGQGNGALTTLNAVYQSVQSILEANGIHHFDERHRVNRPDDAELRRAYVYAATWWQLALEGLAVFRDALDNYPAIPEMRSYREPYSLLLRPIGQVALFQGLARAFETGLEIGEAINRANRLCWSASHPQWHDTIIFRNGRMSTRKEGITLAGRLIAFLIAGELMPRTESDRLARDYSDAADEPRKLPRSHWVA
jgi:DNA sulfur modification protein DndB